LPSSELRYCDSAMVGWLSCSFPDRLVYDRRQAAPLQARKLSVGAVVETAYPALRSTSVNPRASFAAQQTGWFFDTLSSAGTDSLWTGPFIRWLRGETPHESQAAPGRTRPRRLTASRSC
jgi:hypothetical protein